MVGVLAAIKRMVVPSIKKPRTIKFGVFKGLRMNLGLRTQMQVWLGLSEREVFSYLRRFVDQAKTGIDIGAAEGEYAIYYLSRPNIEHVLAVDPSDGFPTDLSANLVLNEFKDDRRPILIKKYAGDHEDCDHCTLDSITANLPGPCVVKLDVDGGEALVLKGAEKFLDRKDVSWIIETHSLELERECERLLQSKGFITSIVKNAWWRVFIPEQRPIPHNRWLVASRSRICLP